MSLLDDIDLYLWSPMSGPAYIDGAVQTSIAQGRYYTMATERDNEGWHGLLLEPDDSEPTGFALLDEDVFSNEYDAQAWCEYRDEMRAKS